MNSNLDRQYMTQALQLAERGRYTTAPNPNVGCVLVNRGQVVGEGWHHKAGAPHAEVNAIAHAGDKARGASAYITLEPCCHHGRTPPCTDALTKAGVQRVIAAMRDPNPQVSGNGIDQLKKAGLEVEVGLLETKAASLNKGYIKRVCEHRPFVRSKLAMTLDGRTAAQNGSSQWITSPVARNDVQRLRAQSDAIITGIGTVLADNPSLNVRLNEVEGLDDKVLIDFKQPLRVIIDSHLRIPPNSRILNLPGDTLVICANVEQATIDRLTAQGVNVSCFPDDKGNVDLFASMAYLAEQGINEVLLESGASLSGAMLQAGLVDELIVYMAPRLLGHQARGLLELPGLEDINESVELQIQDIRAVGADWRITAVVNNFR